ncbi:gp53-like domain-containing protein [Paenibacillus tyrfis]|uniref:gp53-like domain-containing protein n=1 Tax=Paenibacillus tyrfis TaxID=1501230 RepID=UPI00209D5454|nr:hypothetical protein [Paenibacillus tyrfis]MCP1307789.1 hypothetical protein [Paenibacillus tyrfis]
MSGNKTSNLRLHHWTGADQVLRTEFNENFEKIDAFAGQLLAEDPTPVELGYGMQVINAKQTSMLENVSIKGRTLVNLLGRDGNCEDSTKFKTGNGAVLTTDTTHYVYGTRSLKVEIPTGSTSGNAFLEVSSLIKNDQKKKYILIGEVKNGNGTSGVLKFSDEAGYGVLASFVTDATRFNLTYAKIDASQIKVSSSFRLVFFIVLGSGGQYAYVDGIRLYEISQAEYDALDGMTPEQIAAKWPYVDDMKSIYSPYVIKYGENLLPPFSEYKLTNGNGVATDPYALTITSTGTDVLQNECYIDIPAKPNTTYTLSCPAMTGKAKFISLDSSKMMITNGTYSTSQRQSKTTEANCAYLRVLFSADSAGTFTFTNPMLNLGPDALPFKPRNDDYLLFPNIQLASNVDGTVYDTLFQRDGKYWKQTRFKTVDLDGNLGWRLYQDGSGYRTVEISIADGLSDTEKVIKYDGKTIPHVFPLTGADQSILSQSSRVLRLTVSNSDSGWGDLYKDLSTNEIKAYFLGYKMYVAGGSGDIHYNGSGIKAWAYRRPDGGWQDVGINAPTTPAPGFTPYKLQYQLIEATVEEIASEGEITLHEGPNQIEVGNGMIVREKTVPFYDVFLNEYFLNAHSVKAPLRAGVRKYITVYRGNHADKKWSFGTGGPESRNYAVIPASNYDPAAAYTVTYLALDQYALTCNLESIQGEYASNLKKVVDQLAAHQADVEARVSATENLARQVHISQKGVVNPWGDNNSAISKAINGYQKLPSGLILQWGTALISNSGAVTFPVAFPNYVMHVYGQVETSVASQTVGIGSYSNTQFMAWTVTGPPQTIHWFAIGY